MLSTFAISILLAGPITNITYNTAELASSTSCVGDVLVNNTGLIKELARKPYEQLIVGR